MNPALQLRFSGDAAAAASAYPRLSSALDAAGIDGGCRYRIDLVFDEIVTNIVHYGAPDGRALEIGVTLEIGDDSVRMTFEDDGIPFDSSVLTWKPASSSLEDATIGGFGLMLVRKSVSELGYARTPEGRNRLSVAVRRDAA